MPIADTGKWERRRRLMREYIEGNWTYKHELAVRHGVSDTTIGTDLRVIEAILREEMTEEAIMDRDRRVKQHESVIGKSFVAFERSRQDHEEISTRYEKRPCRKCKGDEEKMESCEACEGKGYSIEEAITRKVIGQAGDPRFLGVIQKGLAEICRLKGYYPEKKTYVKTETTAIIGRERYRNVDPELILQQRRLTVQIEQAASGEKEPLDVEFEEGENDEK